MLPRRALVVVATFLLAFLLYVDRVCISTAKGPIVAELGLSDAQFGWALSAFAFGYALLQTPSGMAADRLGARRILAAIVTIWSVFTGLTALAWNFASLVVIRFLFGGNLTLKLLGRPVQRIDYPHTREGFAGDCVYGLQRHFVDRMLDGRPFENTGEDYLRSTALMEACYRSHASGGVVAVPTSL